MSCSCKEILPRSVPARDVGLRSGLKVGFSQLAAARDADRAMAAPPMFANSRNAAYLGVNVHVGGARDGKEVKVSSFSPVLLLAVGGALWFLTRAK